MTKKIIGSIGLVVGLAVVTFFLYVYVLQDQDKESLGPTPSPEEQAQVAVRPTPEIPQEPTKPAPEPAVPPEPVKPAPPESAPPATAPPATAPPAAAPPAAAPPEPAPAAVEPAPPEQIPAPQTPLEPKEEHGLLAGRYRSYGSANKIMEKIKKQDIPAFIRKKGKYYELWAGPFSTPEEAEQARKTLKKTLKISPKKRKLEIPVPK